MSELIFADRGRARTMRSVIVALAIAVSGPAVALTINLTYDPDSTFTAAGLSVADIANMKAAASYAASQFSDNFTDSVNVNIKVTAVSDPGTLGMSNTFLVSVSSYAALRATLSADSTTGDDATVRAARGPWPAADPLASAHTYRLTTAEANALRLRADDFTTDGTFTFGGRRSYTYDPANRAVAGKIDFIGVAMHEFSEIMGRISLMGERLTGSPDYMLMDLFHYTGPGVRGLNDGAGSATAYVLVVGSSLHGTDIYNSGQVTVHSKTVNNIPTDGRTIYVTLGSQVNGSWTTNNYTYTAFNSSATPTPTPTVTPTPTPTPTATPTPTPATGAAAMISPSPGSTFTSSSVTFTWSAGSATAYFLFVGSSLHGADIYNSGIVTVQSKTVNNIPTDGRTIYVTLGSQVSGSWSTKDYTYTAFHQ